MANRNPNNESRGTPGRPTGSAPPPRGPAHFQNPFPERSYPGFDHTAAAALLRHQQSLQQSIQQQSLQQSIQQQSLQQSLQQQSLQQTIQQQSLQQSIQQQSLQQSIQQQSLQQSIQQQSLHGLDSRADVPRYGTPSHQVDQSPHRRLSMMPEYRQAVPQLHDMYGRHHSSRLPAPPHMYSIDQPSQGAPLPKRAKLDQPQMAMPKPQTPQEPAISRAEFSQLARNMIYSSMVRPDISRTHMELSHRPDLTQPLKIDTQDMTVAKRGESMSPSHMGVSTTFDEVKATKEELLGKIGKLDKEINKLEQSITMLQKKQTHLREQQEKAPLSQSLDDESQENAPSLTLAQQIYTENRKKAELAHAFMFKRGYNMDKSIPVYNIPADAPVYHQNILNHEAFRPRLLLFIKRKRQGQRIRTKYLTERYDQLLHQWSKKLEKVDQTPRRRLRNSQRRDFFERVFPELRKQREDRERGQRCGARVGVARSDAELAQIVDGLHEQEEEEKKMKMYAVVPPMMLDSQQRKFCYTNTNGLLESPLEEMKERQSMDIWTDQEHMIFKEKFLQHSKNFGTIAAALEKKSVIDCVRHYYVTKKKEQYKQYIKRQNAARKRKIAKIQRAEIESQVAAATSASATVPSTSTNNDANAKDATAASSSKGETEYSIIRVNEISSLFTNPALSAESAAETRTDSQQPFSKIQKNCLVCEETMTDLGRPLSENDATSLYGIDQSRWVPDARVCSRCHCRALGETRARRCPVPSCRTPKRKVKRLRPVPWGRIQQAPADVRQAVLDEMQLAEPVDKCCSGCFNRIARGLGGKGEPETVESDSTRWSEDEMALAQRGLRQFGRDWAAIANQVKTKSEAQCKNFYFNYKAKFHLDHLVDEFRKEKHDRKISQCESQASTISVEHPSDEEFSSEDNEEDEDEDSEDTASAPESPRPPSDSQPPVADNLGRIGGAPAHPQAASTTADNEQPRQEQRSSKQGKDGYDSSTTLSADEAHQESTSSPTQQDNKAPTRPVLKPPLASGSQPKGGVSNVRQLVSSLIEKTVSDEVLGHALQPEHRPQLQQLLQQPKSFQPPIHHIQPPLKGAGKVDHGHHPPLTGHRPAPYQHSPGSQIPHRGYELSSQSARSYESNPVGRGSIVSGRAADKYGAMTLKTSPPQPPSSADQRGIMLINDYFTAHEMEAERRMPSSSSHQPPFHPQARHLLQRPMLYQPEAGASVIQHSGVVGTSRGAEFNPPRIEEYASNEQVLRRRREMAYHDQTEFKSSQGMPKDMTRVIPKAVLTPQVSASNDQRMSPALATGSNRSSPGASKPGSTLTAASLIDDIITNQISCANANITTSVNSVTSSTERRSDIRQQGARSEEPTLGQQVNDVIQRSYSPRVLQPIEGAMCSPTSVLTAGRPRSYSSGGHDTPQHGISMRERAGVYGMSPLPSSAHRAGPSTGADGSSLSDQKAWHPHLKSMYPQLVTAQAFTMQQMQGQQQQQPQQRPPTPNQQYKK